MPRAFSRHDLQRLLDAQNPPRITIEPVYHRQTSTPDYVASIHETAADNIILAQKGLKTRKPPLFRTKARKRSFYFKIVTDALPKAVDDSQETGVIQSLIRKGGNESVVKNERTRIELQARRADIILKAVIVENVSTIGLLAQALPKARLGDALGRALEDGNQEVIKTLLENGADPNYCHTQIMAFALEGQYTALLQLRRAPLPISPQVAYGALVSAVKSGCSQTLDLLADCAALDQVSQIQAIGDAIDSVRLDLLLILLNHCSTSCAAYLDRNVLKVYERNCLSNLTTCLFIDALLYAGADGGDTCATFVLAVEQQKAELLDIFIKHGVDINWGRAKAARHAARLGDSALLRRVLSAGALSSDGAGNVLSVLSRNMSANDRSAMLNILLDAGARGAAVDQALIHAVQDNRDEDVELLRTRGASFDAAGTALVEAIKSERLHTVSLLLAKPVDPTVMRHAFQTVQTARGQPRFQMAKMLLERGARGEYVDAALNHIICGDPGECHESLIELLIEYGANPNSSRSNSLKHVVSKSDLKMFTRLLRTSSKLTSASESAVVTGISRMASAEIRYGFYKKTIVKGASGQAMSEALCNELEKPQVSWSIIDLLVHSGKADVNFSGGKALCLAALQADEQYLELLRGVPGITRDTINSALTALIQSHTFSDEVKSGRVRQLLRNAEREIAHQGLLLQIRQCAQSHQNGREWPLKVFQVLVDSKPDINHNEGELLLQAIVYVAVPLVQMLYKLDVATAVLNAALAMAMDASNDVDCIDLLSCTLGRGPSGEGISTVLVVAVQRSKSLAVIKLLLEHGPNLATHDYAAVVHAVSHAQTKVLQLLLSTTTSQQALTVAFQHGTLHQDAMITFNILEIVLKAGFRGKQVYEYVIALIEAPHTNLRLLNLCMEYEALSHAQDDHCAVIAAARQKLDVLQALAPRIMTPRVATRCLEVCFAKSIFRSCHPDLLQFLTSYGIPCGLLSTVLLSLVADAGVERGFEKVRILLSGGADVNSHNGESLFRAVELADEPLIELLIGAKSSTETRSRALHALVATDQARVDTHRFCRLLQALVARRSWSSDIPTFSRFQVQYPHALRALLVKRPKSKDEVTAMLDIDPSLLQNRTMPSALSPGHSPAEDTGDLLLWAMTMANPRIGTSAIEFLISKGLKVRHVTSNNETVVMVAIQTGRSKLIDTLRNKGADISLRDDHGRSPLLFAVEQGNMDAVGCLVPYATTDDGSLNQAVRKVSPSMVSLLLDHGHDATMPSTFQAHDRRTPLAEFLNIDLDSTQPQHSKHVLALLINHGADMTHKIQTKPLICAALDSSQATAEALLASGLKNRIDEDFNLYQASGYCYSPTMYAVKLLKRPRDQQLAAQTMLRSYGAQRDVFYKLEGAQPDDAVGMPADIERAEKRRRERIRLEREAQEDADRELARRAQLKEHSRMLAQQAHEETLRLRDAAVAHELRLADQQHHRQLEHSRDIHALEAARQASQAQYRATERSNDLAHDQQRMTLTYENTRKQHDLELSQQRAIADTYSAASDRDLRNRKAMAEGQNWLEEKQHRRAIEAQRSMVAFDDSMRHQMSLPRRPVQKALPAPSGNGHVVTAIERGSSYGGPRVGGGAVRKASPSMGRVWETD